MDYYEDPSPVCSSCTAHLKEVERLKAEVERLRGALEHLATGIETTSINGSAIDGWLRGFTRAVLDGGKKP